MNKRLRPLCQCPHHIFGLNRSNQPQPPKRTAKWENPAAPQPDYAVYGGRLAFRLLPSWADIAEFDSIAGLVDPIMILLGAVIAGLSTLLLAVALIATKRMHGKYTLDSHEGVQKLHSGATPRVGGIALAVGAVIGGLFLPTEGAALWAMIAFAALPAFLGGLAEDVSKKVRARIRLCATILSGLIFCILSGHALQRADLPLVDAALAYWPVAVIFTAVAVGGIANALNIIDGVNGLASGTAIIVLSGFAVTAAAVGDQAVFGVCMIAIGALGGFFLMNFPLGLIFLGDAGAYATGFVLAVIAVVLPARNPELSPILGLLALSYPVIETMVSIHRRMSRAGGNPGAPDRLHLHSLVYRSLSRRLAQALGTPSLRNPLASFLLWVFPLLSAALAVVFRDNTWALWGCIAAVLLLYIGLYRRVALLPTVPEILRPRSKPSDIAVQ